MTLIYIITKLGEHGGDFLRVSCDRNVSRSPRALLCDLFGVQISPRGVACRSWKSNGTFDSQNIKRFMNFLWCWCLRHRFAELDDFDVRPIESLVFSRQTLKSRTDPKIRNQWIRDHLKPWSSLFQLFHPATRSSQRALRGVNNSPTSSCTTYDLTFLFPNSMTFPTFDKLLAFF